MAVFALATAGGGPLGSLIMGYAIGAWGVQYAILVPVIGVTLVTTAVLTGRSIWVLTSTSRR